MEEAKQVFNGRTGKLIISKDGITIQRNFSQAYQQKSKPLTKLSFSDIESVRHRYAADKPGYIELKTKQGSGSASTINRRHQVQFDAATAHRFRRAHKKIARKVLEQELANEYQTTTNNQNQSETTPLNPPTTETFTAPQPYHPIKNPATSANTTTANPPPTTPATPAQLDSKTNSGLKLPYRGGKISL